jgi:hypothetical protein
MWQYIIFPWLGQTPGTDLIEQQAELYLAGRRCRGALSLASVAQAPALCYNVKVPPVRERHNALSTSFTGWPPIFQDDNETDKFIVRYAMKKCAGPQSSLGKWSAEDTMRTRYVRPNLE